MQSFHDSDERCRLSAAMLKYGLFFEQFHGVGNNASLRGGLSSNDVIAS